MASSWITHRDPPRNGTYLTSKLDPDGECYVNISLWQDGRWDTLWGKIQGWQEKPSPLPRAYLIDYSYEMPGK